MIKSGLFCFTFGGLDTRQEFVYIDNLVDAHVLAAVALESGNETVTGQAYFVSDGEVSTKKESGGHLLLLIDAYNQGDKSGN